MDETKKILEFGNTYGTLPTPVKKGYFFQGWYTAPSGGTLVTGNTTITSTTMQILYAHWKKIMSISATKATNETKVHISINGASSCDIIVCGIKSNRLVAIQRMPYSGKDIEFVLKGNFDVIKVMAWNDWNSLSPLCEPTVLPESEWMTE